MEGTPSLTLLFHRFNEGSVGWYTHVEAPSGQLLGRFQGTVSRGVFPGCIGFSPPSSLLPTSCSCLPYSSLYLPPPSPLPPLSPWSFFLPLSLSHPSFPSSSASFFLPLSPLPPPLQTSLPIHAECPLFVLNFNFLAEPASQALSEHPVPALTWHSCV